MENVVYFKKLNDKAVLPHKAHETDAGFDLTSVEDITVKAHGCAVVPTGIAWQCENPLLYMQIQGRSGLCFKSGIELCNAGVIDSGYTGEIKVKLYNTTDSDFEIKAGDRVAQGIILTLPWVHVKELDGDIASTDRGDTGFGMSGR